MDSFTAWSLAAFVLIPFIMALFYHDIKKPKRDWLEAKIERVLDDEYLVTLANGESFRGSGTVWRSYPSGKRCGVFTESNLADVLTRRQWGLQEKLPSYRRWAAEPNGIEQGGVTGRSPQHTRTLDGSLSDDQ